jgi:hypothetical protein
MDYPPGPAHSPGHTHDLKDITDLSGGGIGVPLGGGVAPGVTAFAGTGAPDGALGAIGDVYFRADGTLGSTFIYQKTGASAWTASAA